jgi:gliding motility-associated-like protein
MKEAALVLFTFLFLGVHAQVNIYTPPEKTNCPRSQKQQVVWYFGDKAGIDFRSGSAVALTDEDVMTAYKASGVICDSLGNLLFFTNGKKVWDRTFSLMPNATGLDGDLGVTQPVIIIPQPGNDSLYFVFTVDVIAIMPDNTYTTKGLTYSVVNMKLRGGLGDATDVLNQPLLSPVCQKITATRHANGKDYWVIVHEWDSYAFYAYPVTQWGIGTPVVTNAGELHGGGYADQANAYGYMKISPDGKTLAVAITGDNIIQILDFDNSTGKVSSPRTYTTTFTGVSPYGLDFSPDSRKMYATVLQITGNGPPANPSRVLQFDLSAGLGNPVTVDSTAGIRLSGVQLGPDGRVYIDRTINLLAKNDSLDVIYNPSRPGIQCNYNLLNNTPGSRFALQSGRYGIFSLPNLIQSFLDIPAFTYDSCCYKDVMHFRITNTANIDSVTWEFGDGNTSTGLSPFHLYAAPGSYLVRLTEHFNGLSFIDTMSIVVHTLPPVELGDTILLYKGATINLHAGGGYMQYQWSTGSTDSVIAVKDQGDYTIDVKDFHCCTNQDTVYIKVFEYFIPNAFTPNGDGRNDTFRAVGLYRNIRYNLQVYDRWGEMVFETNDLDTGWDGKFHGGKCPPDTYVWVIHVDFLGQDIITNGSIVLKGTVTIVK